MNSAESESRKSNKDNRIVKNSIWGLASTILQTLFLSILFVIISKRYNIADFSNFLISSTLYQLTVGFSSMGLGHWFIRQYEENIENRPLLTSRFIKIQVILGSIFYLVNIILAILLYEDTKIQILAIILGTNIVFDNIIYAIKTLNIAQWQQKKTSVILSIDGFLRLIIGCSLFIFPLSIYQFSILSVIVRLLTVNVFINYGTSEGLKFRNILKSTIHFKDFKEQVFVNWRFVVIAGMSILFWRSATLIISKFLTAYDVANYEISYKFFSLFAILPLVASNTIYPTFVNLITNKRIVTTRTVYELTYWIYTFVAITCYAFIQSYAETIVFLLFGPDTLLAVDSLKAMMLTFLILPTVILQANVLLAMRMEKVDMLCNVFVLIINLTTSIIGLYIYPKLSIINYSIFGSFIIFHIIQSIFLIKENIGSVRSTLTFYLIIITFVASYYYLGFFVDENIVFASFILLIISLATLFNKSILSNLRVFQTLKSPVPSENPDLAQV